MLQCGDIPRLRVQRQANPPGWIAGWPKRRSAETSRGSAGFSSPTPLFSFCFLQLVELALPPSAFVFAVADWRCPQLRFESRFLPRDKLFFCPSLPRAHVVGRKLTPHRHRRVNRTNRQRPARLRIVPTRHGCRPPPIQGHVPLHEEGDSRPTAGHDYGRPSRRCPCRFSVRRRHLQASGPRPSLPRHGQGHGRSVGPPGTRRNSRWCRCSLDPVWSCQGLQGEPPYQPCARGSGRRGVVVPGQG